jgi:polysaccharide export outer membrane protein
MFMVRIISLALVVVTWACGSGGPRYPYADEPNPKERGFIIGVADRLRINVRNNNDLSSEVTVRPDGAITMPLIGDVRAEGKTPARLTKEIRDRLSQYIKDPTAVPTVEVIEINSYRFTVSGEVVSPGIYNSQRYVTVVEALNMGGGLSRFAKRDGIKVIRCCDAAGEKKKIPIDYDAILRGDTEMNIYILAGDEVLVP